MTPCELSFDLTLTVLLGQDCQFLSDVLRDTSGHRVIIFGFLSQNSMMKAVTVSSTMTSERAGGVPTGKLEWRGAPAGVARSVGDPAAMPAAVGRAAALEQLRRFREQLLGLRQDLRRTPQARHPGGRHHDQDHAATTRPRPGATTLRAHLGRSSCEHRPRRSSPAASSRWRRSGCRRCTCCSSSSSAPDGASLPASRPTLTRRGPPSRPGTMSWILTSRARRSGSCWATTTPSSPRLRRGLHIARALSRPKWPDCRVGARPPIATHSQPTCRDERMAIAAMATWSGREGA